MTIDLDKLIKDHGYEAEITPPEPEPDANLRRFKDRWLFFTALLMLVVLTASMLGWLVLGSPAAEDKKWIFGLLGTVFGFTASVLSKR